jgi:hypothetical protein
MEKVREVRTDNFDEIFSHLEEVYGNAQWALRYGATKEDLLSQIEEAVELHEDSLGEEGWLIVTPPTL